jgi:hypothetical protein
METTQFPEESEEKRKSRVRAYLSLWIIVAILVGAAPLLALKGRYGLVLFVSIPFSIGVASALIASRNKMHTKAKYLLLIPFAPLGILALVLAFFAREGIICILMSLPIVSIPLVLGGFVGYVIQKHYWSKYFVLLFVFMINTGAYVHDKSNTDFETCIVEDSVVVNAAPDVVWKKLSHRFVFGKADNFFLANGVSFPLSMELKTSQGCNSLFCVYNNGIVNAIVDSLVPERLIRFSLHEPPVSMKETTIYSDVEPDHIRGRILVDYGSFRLIPHNGKTILKATTRFKSNLGPKFYWKLWSEYLVNRLHQHVLEKISQSCKNH